jgi:hypothetical protein
MYYYQSGGVLQRPFNVSVEMFLDEIKFFDLGDEVIEKYTEDEGMNVEDVKVYPKNLLQRKIWLLFEYPESSHQAKIVAILSVVAIIVSLVIFCMETLGAFIDTDKKQPHKSSSSNHHNIPVDNYDNDDIHAMTDPFYFVETTCICWFCFELLMRFLSCPNKSNFMRGMTNLVDLVAIIPYFVGLIVDAEKDKYGTDSLSTLRVIRLVRVFRIFKLSRHNRGLKILGKTLKASIRELGLLVIFLLIAVILFSSSLYFAEYTLMGPSESFPSIPATFWWAIQTMTTGKYFLSFGLRFT